MEMCSASGGRRGRDEMDIDEMVMRSMRGWQTPGIIGNTLSHRSSANTKPHT